VSLMLLITGCKGYVGQLLVLRLKKEGVDFRCVDLTACENNLTGHANCDISSAVELERLKILHGPFHGVIHLAAIKTVVTTGHESRDLMKSVNQHGTDNVISMIMEGQDTFFIFASSAAVYGDNQSHKIIYEDFDLKPLSLYGETKLYGEKTLRISFDEGLINRVICLRFFNISGHQVGSVNSKSELGGAICHAASANNLGKAFTVFGTSFNTEDGTAVRDYLHVDDVVESIFKSLRIAEKSTDDFYEVINVCSGIGTSLLGVIAEINNQTKSILQVDVEAKRQGEIEFSIGNRDKAWKILRWRPERDLSTIVSTDLAHHRNNLA
jgi:UDP-glucose 4-epimerase